MKFVKINSKWLYLWRLVEQDSEVEYVYLQTKRDGAALKQLFTRLLGSYGSEPWKIVTDKLRGCGATRREWIAGLRSPA